MRIIDMMGITAARSTWGTCSLNEFRKFLGLEQFTEFKRERCFHPWFPAQRALTRSAFSWTPFVLGIFPSPLPLLLRCRAQSGTLILRSSILRRGSTPMSTTSSVSRIHRSLVNH